MPDLAPVGDLLSCSRKQAGKEVLAFAPDLNIAVCKTLSLRYLSRKSRMRSNSNFAPYLLIGIGTYFLLSKLGWIPSLFPLIWEWWPVVLIIIGASMLVKRYYRDKS